MSVDVDVTEAMGAVVDGRPVGAMYGTRALLDHIVGLCRSIVEPHLEIGEQALDVAVDFRHRSPVPVGARVTLDATVAAVEPTRLTCEVMVRHNGLVVARGTLEQHLVRLDEFRDQVAASEASAD